jgi:hydrogenase expression/formation protein HypC
MSALRSSSAGPSPSSSSLPADGLTCSSEHCITCGDIAVEVRVVRLLPDDLAVVATSAGDEQVSVAVVSAAVGDTILVHAGEAIAVVGG